MSNQQTISDLRQSIQALEAQDADLVARQNVVSESVIQIDNQLAEFFKQTSRLPSGSPERIAINQQMRELAARRDELRAQNSQLSQQILDIDAQIQRFERQIGTLESGGTTNQPTPVQTQDPEVAQLLNAELTPEQITQDNLNNAFGPPENIRPVTLQPQQFDQIASERAFGDGSDIPPAPVTQRQIEQRNQEEAFLPAEQQTVRYSNPPPAESYQPPSVPEPTTPPVSDPASANPRDVDIGQVSVAKNPQNPPNIANEQPPPDWRVRLSLSPSSNYLYNADDPGILLPLRNTDGVIYPYTPQINVTYTASYDSQTITHSNYKFHTYQGSSVESISITGDFTAQDIDEANYLLAVIHFFRSASKMFYGQDQDPSRGIPPPLLYLSGHGAYQFDRHPVVITNFTYNLPNDVDYINAVPDKIRTLTKGNFQPKVRSSSDRLRGSGLQPGGLARSPVFTTSRPLSAELTRVPTKISIALSLLPIMSRNSVSNRFSLRDYASGKLLRGSQSAEGGMW